MKISIAIPARLQSTRLPQKMLADICGKPLLWHVVHQVLRMKNCHELFVLTDDKRILEAAESWGIKALLTSPDCRSGTERIASVLDKFSGDWIFNVQGDEPFIDPVLLDEMVEIATQTDADIITPIFKIQNDSELFNPNVVKVVLGQKQRALYFSRSPIPFVRGVSNDQWLKKNTFWGHIGVYGYHHSTLKNFHNWPETSLEVAESLEQLRWLAAGCKLSTHVTTYQAMAVDTPEDLEKVRKRMLEIIHTTGYSSP